MSLSFQQIGQADWSLLRVDPTPLTGQETSLSNMHAGPFDIPKHPALPQSRNYLKLICPPPGLVPKLVLVQNIRRFAGSAYIRKSCDMFIGGDANGESRVQPH